MEVFKTHRGIVATLDRANVDTDAIIPKQFLKSIKRTGFGEHLFSDWRYLEDGNPNPEFSLNRKEFKGASILVVRNNFGCGSSREHAVWAVRQYGFRVVVAPWKMEGKTQVPAFADIFKNNCVKNSVLTIELAEEEVEIIFQLVSKNPGVQATVNLEKERFYLHYNKEMTFAFDVDPSVKSRLLSGLDDIGLTLQKEKEISDFETRHDPQIQR
ncbi:MAG: 3-isopropylmalate dehydratase small subunit [Candidatus Omnitrophica bacterium]|nr:3-isopropylmalate dehydratase small subunit [Candidatus Omnitrophota bacterium]